MKYYILSWLSALIVSLSGLGAEGLPGKGTAEFPSTGRENNSRKISIPLTGDPKYVHNLAELRLADSTAHPGDVIVLANGTWNDVAIILGAKGTVEEPITFRAETPGRVRITGHSSLKVGGEWLVVEGLKFVDGFAGEDDVVSFRIDKSRVAENCRLTDCEIDDYNNPKRMVENFWVSFYGRHNRIDHCTFRDKKNMGVLVMVALEEQDCRQNFHSIDHNHFARRPPLASNSGEIIRVGVAQTSHYESNTQITDNLFQECDGETEIISIKSAGNLIRGNLFFECQGGVVLRHGNFNTVENNLFYGNGKVGTGGVRIINKGQWVVNNLFYNCRGIDFRAPLSVMNGVPNSPLFRYVQVTDAVIANNSFVNCTPISLCEGSDTERTAIPDNVSFLNNIFSNDIDTLVFRAFDRINGFRFLNNAVGGRVSQVLPAGFERGVVREQKIGNMSVPVSRPMLLPDSLQHASERRLEHGLRDIPGFGDAGLADEIYKNAFANTGASWHKPSPVVATPGNRQGVAPGRFRQINCSNADQVYQALTGTDPVTIILTGHIYKMTRPFLVNKRAQITTMMKMAIGFQTSSIPAVFMIGGAGHLTIKDLNIDGSAVHALSLISSDTSGSSGHYNLLFTGNRVSGLNRVSGCRQIFRAYRSMVADSLIFSHNVFESNECDAFQMADETGNKGYYNVERLIISHNAIRNQTGVLLNILRGGSDESTMGPWLSFTHNMIKDCRALNPDTLIRLTGVQNSMILSNRFRNANPGLILISYTDIVRAHHLLARNEIDESGAIKKNIFVTEDSKGAKK